MCEVLRPPTTCDCADVHLWPRLLADMQAHVAYLVVVLGRNHMQIGCVYQEKQCGPSFGDKCMSLYGPMEIWCVSSRLGPSVNVVISQP